MTSRAPTGNSGRNIEPLDDDLVSDRGPRLDPAQDLGTVPAVYTPPERSAATAAILRPASHQDHNGHGARVRGMAKGRLTESLDSTKKLARDYAATG